MYLQAGVDNEGTIQYLNTTAYEDAGIAFNDNAILPFMVNAYSNVYSTESWDVKLFDVRTDKPCNCWTRGPGMVIWSLGGRRVAIEGGLCDIIRKTAWRNIFLAYGIER